MSTRILTLNDLSNRGINITQEQYNNILHSNEEILRTLNNKWFYERISVEYYENGSIKRIKKKFDKNWLLVLGVLGACTLILGGVAIYVIGPTAVKDAAIAIAKASKSYIPPI